MIDGFVKICAASPEIRLADVEFNASQILAAFARAESAGAKILVLPELCLTGATCGDLFLHSFLVQAASCALAGILEKTAKSDCLAVIGLPAAAGDCLYNAAAVIHRGRILGLTAKISLFGTNDSPFSPPPVEPISLRIAGCETQLCRDILFRDESGTGLSFAVEIGCDMAMPMPPADRLLAGGANLLLCPAAIPSTAGGIQRLDASIAARCDRLICGCAIALAGQGESTTDRVYFGRGAVFEAGKRLCADESFALTEMDTGALLARRRKSRCFSCHTAVHTVAFSFATERTQLTRTIDRDPFMDLSFCDRNAYCRDTFELQASGLARRLTHTRAKCAVIGISGGLDSTLALLVSARACEILGRSSKDVLCVTMPCFGTSERTKNNATQLCELLGVQLRCVEISGAVLSHLSDIGHDPQLKNVTYENAQARERTQVLMDLANKEGGILVGTGDLSELCLGFATYNGDHMSMYGVNAGVPKTLIRHIVASYADCCGNEPLSKVLRDILDTPVSPELLPPEDGVIGQRTEEILGDYILQDFFIYHVLSTGASPRKVLRMAEYAFAGKYSREYIKDKLCLFYRRFIANQFKRSCLPDGPAPGEISLSPRDGLHMPSDAVADLWLAELENL
ncbi:MAG: NAD(+) synthase [Clostridia bacterium]|nr:NAD(+) synthase [Clostridia bacterium]